MPVPGHSSEEAASSVRPKKKAGRNAKAAASVTSTHLNQNCQLLEAIAQGKPRVVRRLLDSRADPNYQGGPSMASPLMLACEIRDEEARETIVDLLLAKGADVNLQDAAGKTVLMKAVLLDLPSVFSKMLQKSADASLVDIDGNVALSYAAEVGDVECVKSLVKKKSVHPDHQNLQGLTPLLLAAREGHLEVAKILVDAGASLSKRDLDQFMTAQEWMKLSSCYSHHQLQFLSPSAKKKNFYRQERMKKGIKTLADYLPRRDESSGYESPNVFTISDNGSVQFPSLRASTFSAPTTPQQERTTSSVKSMFDVPAKKQISPLQHSGSAPTMDSMVKRRSSIAFPSIASVKTDLYSSSYLTRRKSLLLKNSLSDGYHTGALAPLTSTTNSLAQPSHSRDMPSTNKTSRLPPINK